MYNCVVRKHYILLLYIYVCSVRYVTYIVGSKMKHSFLLDFSSFPHSFDIWMSRFSCSSCIDQRFKISFPM
jgi:hypothetical protein